MCHRTRSFGALITGLLLSLGAGRASARDLVLTPSLTLEERYDSNARFRDSSMKSDRSDIISTASPQFVLAGEGKRYELNGQYRLSASYHSLNPDLNNVAHWLRFDTDITASEKTSLFFGDTLNYTEDSLRATETEILVTRTDILTNTAYAGVKRQMTKNTDMEVRLRDRLQEFDSEELIDNRTDAAELSAGYRYSASGTARLMYVFTNYAFNTADDKEVQSHSVQVHVTETVSPTLAINIGGGGTYIPNLDSGDGYFLEAAAGMEKTYRDTVLTLGYTREITVPTGLLDEINLSDRVTAGIHQTITEALNATVTVGFAKNRTKPSERVDFNGYIADAEAVWLPYRWLQLGVGVSHYQQWNGDDIGTNLSRNRAFVNVTFISDGWRF